MKKNSGNKGKGEFKHSGCNSYQTILIGIDDIKFRDNLGSKMVALTLKKADPILTSNKEHNFIRM